MEPRRKNSSGRRPLTLFVTGSLNCWMANVLDELTQTSVPPSRMNASKAARSSAETLSAYLASRLAHVGRTWPCPTERHRA